MSLLLPDGSPLTIVGDRYPTPADLIAAEVDEWEMFDHLAMLNAEVTETLTTPNSFLVVELPIRHGKSLHTTVGGCAWSMLNWPADGVLLGCHTNPLAARFGRQIRNICRHRGPEFGLRLSRESAAAKEFHWAGYDLAGFKGVGVGSTPTGLGGKRVFVDDPVKNLKQLRQLAQRDDLWEWFTEDLRGRMRPGGSMVVVMSRWSDDDIIARIFSEFYGTGDPWRRLTLPARALEGDPLGRPLGAALSPGPIGVPASEGGGLGYDLATLAQLELTMVNTFAPQFLMTAAAPKDKPFKRENWATTTVIPAGSIMVRWWDNAATKGGTGAFTAGVLIAYPPDGRPIVCDVVRQRLGPAERRAKQRAVALEDQTKWARYAVNGRVTTGAEQEPGSGGVDQRDLFLTEVMAGLPAVTETTGGQGKEIRAETWAAQQGAQRVRILWRTQPTTGIAVPPEWEDCDGGVGAYIGEHYDFPTGGTKDMVDASAHAYNWAALRAPKGTTSSTVKSEQRRRLGNPNV